MLGGNERKSRKIKTELKWEEKRKFFENRGWEIGEMERKREERETWLVS